jgi:Kef-type K+ transport system membrane component KefB
MRRALLALLLLALCGAALPAQRPAATPADEGVAEGAAAPERGGVPAPEHAAGDAHGGGETAGGHANPVAPVLLGLVVILVAAKLGGRAAERLHQPAVLGELLAGVLLGNVALLGWGGLEFLGSDPGIRILAELGVILLLFEVGLESDVAEMKAVGWSSLLVAVLGVVAPMLLGWGVSAWMLPDEPTLLHVFIGATLCATSVGITARVLADLGKLQQRESKVILGAAVIDDVLGLVVLAVVAGSIQAANRGDELDALGVGWVILKAAAFLFAALAVGGPVSRRLLRLAARLQVRGMLLVASLGFCFLLAWLANAIELATIVGAFAAGLILDEVHFHQGRERQERPLEDLLQPIATVLVPIFFVRMGAEVDLASFGRVEVLGLAAVLTVAAVLGKLACAAGVVERGLDRLSVAVGMIPRGEVGLIFAAVGAQLMLGDRRVVSPGVFSALVVMVIVTTLVTPPVLAVTLRRGERRQAAVAAARERREAAARAAQG